MACTSQINDRLIGDSNDDGVFDSLDLAQVLRAGKYNDGISKNATFEEGDWNGDGDFDALDLVFCASVLGATIRPQHRSRQSLPNWPPGTTSVRAPPRNRPRVNAGYRTSSAYFDSSEEAAVRAQLQR